MNGIANNSAKAIAFLLACYIGSIHLAADTDAQDGRRSNPPSQNRNSDRDTRATNPPQQDRERGDQRRTAEENKQDQPVVVAIIHLRGGQRVEVTKFERQRNGDLQVTTVDGREVTLPRNRIQRIEQVPETKQEGDETDSDPPTRADTRPTPDKFTLKLTNGRELTGRSIRQLNRQQWQLTTERGQQVTLPLSTIAEIFDGSGRELQPSVGRDGEIIWRWKTDNAGPGRRPPSGETTTPAPGVDVTMYDTWSAAGSNRSESSRVIQSFLATGNLLEQIEVRASGPYQIIIRVMDPSGNQELGSQTVGISGGVASANFSPPIPLAVGEMYTVSLQRTGSSGNLTVQVTNDERYVFSQARFRRNNDWMPLRGDAAQNDLVMRIRGKGPSAAAVSRPTQRALLVLLENGGVTSSLEAAHMAYPDLPEVPYMVYTGGEGDIEFKLNINETIAQALMRVRSQLEAFARSQLGPPPTPPTISTPAGNVPNPSDPSYVAALATYNANLAALTAKLLNPANWEIRMQSAEQFADAIGDFVLEHFTESWIRQKAQGKYQRIEVMNNADFRADRILNMIKQLAPNYVLDIHVLAHGGTDVIVGADLTGDSVKEQLDRENFFVPLQQGRLTGEIPLHLRVVYQCNCHGGTLKREWMGVGAQTVCGTEGEVHSQAKLNYLPHQYIFFMNDWCDTNRTYRQALDRAYNQAVAMSVEIYSALSDKPGMMEGSKLTVMGNGNIRRTSP